MISTTQLRVLRTFPHNFSSQSSSCLAGFSNAPYRRIQYAQALCAAPRSFVTSSRLRQQPQAEDHNVEVQTVKSTDLISSVTANPPPTTRPPPLVLPTRQPESSKFSHLFATGKAYLNFYKTGLRHIYINTRLVWSLNTASGIPPDPTPPGVTAEPPPPPNERPVATTRSAELLRRRWRYDVRRLPVFALMLLICGEFTPLVVLAVPSLVPMTCRIPRQVEKLRLAAEERRHASFDRLRERYGSQLVGHELEGSGQEVEGEVGKQAGRDDRHEASASLLQVQHQHDLAPADVTAHVARSLNLISTFWDRLPLSLLPDTSIAVVSSRRVRQHLAYLDQDDHMIVQAGGVEALENEEVLLACEDRGILPVERADGELLSTSARENLQRWLYLVGDGQVGSAEGSDHWGAERVSEREARMTVLLTTRKWLRL